MKDPTPTKTSYEIVAATGILEDQNRSVKEISMAQVARDLPERLFDAIKARREHLAAWLGGHEGHELANAITTRIDQSRDLRGFLPHVWDIAECEMPFQLKAKRTELKRLNRAAVETDSLQLELIPA